MNVDAVPPCPRCGEVLGGRYDWYGEQLCWSCFETAAELKATARRGGRQEFTADDFERAAGPQPVEMTVVTLAEFVAVAEAGAAALLGDEGAALIPENGDVMVYGDGGAGKTTLAVDLAFHLAAGDGWLGIAVPRPVGVLLIENEGPRALLRRKLGRKADAWTGGDLGDRLRVFERPWGDFSLAPEHWRERIAAAVTEHDIDVLIAGPLTRIGMNAAGTLQEVDAFMGLVRDLRARCGRPLTVVLIHHENKGGKVSGAWEFAGDTLLHVESAGNGHTIVFVQKARWDPTRHGTTIKLAWADGERFAVEGDRDLIGEITDLLADDVWRTKSEIAAARDKGGIAANLNTVYSLLKQHPDQFESRTGDAAKALGRQPSAVLWSVYRGADTPDTAQGSLWGDGTGVSGGARRAPTTRYTYPPGHRPESDRQYTRVACTCVDGGADPSEDGRCSRCWGYLNDGHDVAGKEQIDGHTDQ